MILQTNYKMKPPPSAKPIKSILKKLSCVGLWIMNANGGLSVYDLSGNDNKGTFIQNTMWATGKYGPAVSFDGITDRIELANSLVIGSELTVVASIRHTQGSAPSHGKRIIDNKTTWNANTGFSWALTASDDDAMEVIGSGATVLTIQNCVTSWAAGKTHHAVLTIKGTTASVYIDGVYRGGGAVNALADSTNAPYIGAYYNNPNSVYNWQGLIDFIFICNRALTASEIAQLYQEPFYMFGRKRQPVITAAAPPPEVACQWSSLTTNLWWLKHNKGLFTKL